MREILATIIKNNCSYIWKSNRNYKARNILAAMNLFPKRETLPNEINRIIAGPSNPLK